MHICHPLIERMFTHSQLSRDVLRLSPTPIKSLYTLLEASFDPLTLCSSTAPLLAELCAPDTPYFGYHSLLERALLSRLLAQLSQVYSTLTITSLLELVTPLEGLGPEQVEAFLMGCARRGERSVHVDHATGTITFIDEGFVLSSDDPIPSTSTNTEASIQPSAAELVRTRLSTLAVTLHNSLAILYPPPQLSPEEEEAAQHAKFTELVAAANAERHALSLRRALVARRRELLSELSARKEKEEASRRAETTRREKDEEVRRAKLEMAKKERERAQKEVDSIRAEEAKKLAQTLIKKGNLKVSVDVRIPFFKLPT
jgi:translation initiation factor 3 subunit A